MVGLSREQLLTWQLASSEQASEESWGEKMMEGTTFGKAGSEMPASNLDSGKGITQGMNTGIGGSIEPPEKGAHHTQLLSIHHR